MDTVSFQTKLKDSALIKDSLMSLSRDLSAKLISTESTILKALDADLVLQQAIWFVFSQQLSQNHEYPSNQYSDLSKPAHELSKPFSYNTEQEYLNLLNYFKAYPQHLASSLFHWDSVQSLSQTFPTGLNKDTMSFILAYSIIRDLFGLSDDSTETISFSPSTPLTLTASFLTSYIEVIHKSYISTVPAIEMDFITWALRPQTIFPKLLSIFIQTSCRTALSNAVLPMISWFQSNEHLDLSGDWISLLVGLQQSVTQRQVPLAPIAGDIPPPQQYPQSSTMSPLYMNIFTTFCHLSNLTLAQPGALSQLAINFLCKLVASFQTLFPPQIINIFQQLSSLPNSTSTPQNHHPSLNLSIDLDPLHNLVYQSKQIIGQQQLQNQQTNRQHLQSLFSPQLWNSFLPLLSINELSPTLPNILLPQTVFQPFSTTDDSEPTPSSPQAQLVQQLFSESPTISSQYSSILSIIFKVIIKPLLHTPEEFNIVTTTPITAISRRNLVIVSKYINFLFQTSTEDDLDHKLFQTTSTFASGSLEQYFASSSPSPLPTATSSPTPLLQSPALSSQASQTVPTPQTPITTPSGPASPTNTQISFLKTSHLPQVALIHFISVFQQSYGLIQSLFQHTISIPNNITSPLNTTTPLPDIEITAIPLNSLYVLHSLATASSTNKLVEHESLQSILSKLPPPPALLPPSQRGNRYLLLKFATPLIDELKRNFDHSQEQVQVKFWTIESLSPIITDFFQQTTLQFNDDDRDIDVNSIIAPLKQSVLSIAACLSALPLLQPSPQNSNPISMILSLSRSFGQTQNTPQALILLESLSSIIYGLPSCFSLHNYALLVHILEKYQQCVTSYNDSTSTTLTNLSTRLISAINQQIPSLSSKFRARTNAVISTIFKYQVRKHIATHYTTILSFHTFLAKEIPQNLNLFNGYQRVYHRYISSLLPGRFEYYFKNILHKSRNSSTPSTLPLPPPTSQYPTFSSDDPAFQKSKGYFSTFLKTVPPSSSHNLTSLALNELYKSSLSAFINLPLNGITAMLHPSCGGRYPADSTHDIYICTECNVRFQQKQKILKSFVSKYFGDRILTLPTPTPQNPKRIIELTEISGYGGGGFCSGITGLCGQFSLDHNNPNHQSSPITPLQSYTSVIDYVLSHTTLKMFSICPGADNRWSLDISFLRCFPTFSSFYSYMAQPQNDSIDCAIVLPLVFQHICASLQAYHLQYVSTSTPASTPTASISPPTPSVPTLEEDPLGAIAAQQTATTNNEPAVVSPQSKLTEWVDHIYIQLISILPQQNSTSTGPSDSSIITPLTILPYVPYVGHSTIVEALLQLERALTVSSLQSKLYAFESLRTILTSSLANPLLSTLPFNIQSSVDGLYYKELNNNTNSNTDISTSPIPCWESLHSTLSPEPPTYSHSLLQRNISNQFPQPYQFANLYDFGYICHEKSPHHSSLSVYQLNQVESTPPPPNLNHSRFFDKHTKLAHITPFYPSLQSYLQYFSHDLTSTHTALLLNKLKPHTNQTIAPFYPFIEQTPNSPYASRTKSVNSADDFIFLLCYTLIIAQPRHLPSTLSFLKILFFGLSQSVGFSHSLEAENKAFLDICLAFRAIQGVGDRLRHNAKALFEKLMPQELLHFSKTHLSPKPYNPLSSATRPTNKIESQKTLIVQTLVSEGYYNTDDCIAAVESLQSTQALFDENYKTILINKLRAQKPTY